ncbi:MAG: glutaminase [Terracidiphilus sp.]|nr:glutaminase [Terracidiphilus sp.]
MAERFRYFLEKVKDLAGGGKVGYSQPTYMCEFDTAWRNRALTYYLEEAGVFPVDVTPEAALDFYIQCCSIEVNTVSAAGIAATLANGGTSPLTGKHCLSSHTLRAVLTLMFTCGMYDYSGEWCVHVGLPGKSGVAGLIYVVIPHVMGIAIFSPPLDSHGNSVKGVEFCKALVTRFPYGVFDKLTVRGPDAPPPMPMPVPAPSEMTRIRVPSGPVTGSGGSPPGSPVTSPRKGVVL